MTTFIIPILRQMMELAVVPASSPKLSPGSRNTSDEQHLSMTSCIIAILRQMITVWVIAILRQSMELAVFPASLSKLENGLNRNQVFP